MPRSLSTPPSSSDTGDPDPAAAAALTAYARDPRRRPEALAALQSGRLLVPVVPVGDEDAGVDMATVLLTGPDGRLGLLAFTGLPALRAWDPEARPVPVPTRQAARAALQEGAAALVVDVAGPVRLAVTGDDLRGLAHGWSVVRVGADFAWARPADGG